MVVTRDRPALFRRLASANARHVATHGNEELRTGVVADAPFAESVESLGSRVNRGANGLSSAQGGIHRRGVRVGCHGLVCPRLSPCVAHDSAAVGLSCDSDVEAPPERADVLLLACVAHVRGEKFSCKEH